MNEQTESSSILWEKLSFEYKLKHGYFNFFKTRLRIFVTNIFSKANKLLHFYKCIRIKCIQYKTTKVSTEKKMCSCVDSEIINFWVFPQNKFLARLEKHFTVIQIGH